MSVSALTPRLLSWCLAVAVFTPRHGQQQAQAAAGEAQPAPRQEEGQEEVEGGAADG